MWIRKTIAAALLVMLLSLPAGWLEAQIIYGEPPAGGLQLIYSSWSVDDGDSRRDISQVTVPASGFVPLRNNFEARFYIANAANSMTWQNDDYTLNGISDFRVQFSHAFYDDRLLASFGVNLPIGKKELTADEDRAIVESLADNYLSFPLRRLGEGFGFQALVGTATMIGTVRFGSGLAFQYNGSYSPYRDVEEYDPGDEFSLNISADVGRGRSSFNGDIIYSLFTKDRLAGNDVLKQSPRLDLRFGWNFDNRLYLVNTNARFLVRGHHERYDVENGELIDNLKLYGDEFLLNGAVTFHPFRFWYATPTLEFKAVTSNENELGDATVFGLGGNIARQIGDDISLNAGFKYFVGSADAGALDITGFQLTTGLRAAL